MPATSPLLGWLLPPQSSFQQALSPFSSSSDSFLLTRYASSNCGPGSLFSSMFTSYLAQGDFLTHTSLGPGVFFYFLNPWLFPKSCYHPLLYLSKSKFRYPTFYHPSIFLCFSIHSTLPRMAPRYPLPVSPALCLIAPPTRLPLLHAHTQNTL